MSTPPLQRRSCIDKIRHRSQKSAWDVIKKMREQGRDTKGMHAYRCRYCTGYHVGHRSEI